MLESGRYGVQWTPRPRDPETPALVRVVVIVLLAALASLGWSIYHRFRDSRKETPPTPTAETKRAAISPAPATATPPPAPPAGAGAPAIVAPAVESADAKRPNAVRLLLMRLAEAEQRKNLEMAVSTIERLRELPGHPAEDLDDKLARRLGTLNMRRLFSLRCAQWVTTVTVRGGDTASRIAAEHGSTLASLVKLNGLKTETIRKGQTLYVLNHPRFSLNVHRRSRIADLYMNGKFFHRYDLPEGVSATIGSHAVTLPIRAFWKTIGLSFRAHDRDEIELLMPKGATVIVSEM